MAGKAFVSLSSSNSMYHLEGEIQPANVVYPAIQDGKPRVLDPLVILSPPSHDERPADSQESLAESISAPIAPPRPHVREHLPGMERCSTPPKLHVRRKAEASHSSLLIRWHISPPPIKRLVGEYGSDGEKSPVNLLTASYAQLRAENRWLKDTVVEVQAELKELRTDLACLLHGLCGKLLLLYKAIGWKTFTVRLALRPSRVYLGPRKVLVLL
uniref:Uncharacterized protein n=1 Tax=Oryza punctata TaxID=4537 RepID=A0A0E0M5V3_ORYPU